MFFDSKVFWTISLYFCVFLDNVTDQNTKNISISYVGDGKIVERISDKTLRSQDEIEEITLIIDDGFQFEFESNCTVDPLFGYVNDNLESISIICSKLITIPILGHTNQISIREVYSSTSKTITTENRQFQFSADIGAFWEILIETEADDCILNSNQLAEFCNIFLKYFFCAIFYKTYTCTAIRF